MKKDRAVAEFSKRLKRFLRKRSLKLLEVRAVLVCERDGKIEKYVLLFAREYERRLETQA